MTASAASPPREAIALSFVHAGLEALGSLELHSLSQSALVELARTLEAVAQQLPAVVARVDAHLSDRKVPKALGHLNDASLLSSLHRLTRADARARLRVADLVCDRHTITGETLEPRLPAMARVFAAGQVSPAHVLVVGDVLQALPEPVRREHEPMIDVVLAEHATTLNPRDLKALGQRIVATLHPDGSEPSDGVRDHTRTGWLKVRPDGSGELWAQLTPSAVALWQTILTPMMKSGQEPDVARFDDEGPAEPDRAEAVPSCPDERTPGQRFHDALEEAAVRLLRSKTLPSTAGVPTTLLVSVELRDLERRIGRATTHHGGTLTIAEALRLAVDCKVVPVILGDAGEVLAFGQGRRLASPGQRRALFARDIGCTFPGCTTPAAQSEVHHAHEWAHGGGTDVDNLTVACGYHQNEAIRHGWQTVMRNGRAYWRPPAYLDASRRLQRNVIWDAPLRR